MDWEYFSNDFIHFYNLIFNGLHWFFDFLLSTILGEIIFFTMIAGLFIFVIVKIVEMRK